MRPISLPAMRITSSSPMGYTFVWHHFESTTPCGKCSIRGVTCRSYHMLVTPLTNLLIMPSYVLIIVIGWSRHYLLVIFCGFIHSSYYSVDGRIIALLYRQLSFTSSWSFKFQLNVSMMKDRPIFQSIDLFPSSSTDCSYSKTMVQSYHLLCY